MRLSLGKIANNRYARAGHPFPFSLVVNSIVFEYRLGIAFQNSVNDLCFTRIKVLLSLDFTFDLFLQRMLITENRSEYTDYFLVMTT